jgi:hypothetical protein
MLLLFGGARHLILSPSNLASGDWTKSNCTATYQQITDTSDGAPTNHGVFASFHPAVVTGVATTISAELKAGSLNYALLFGVFPGSYSYVNLAAGTIGVNTGCTPSIVALGDGWHRLSLAMSAGQYSAKDMQLFTAISDTTGGRTYTGAGTGTILARNFKLVQ